MLTVHINEVKEYSLPLMIITDDMEAVHTTQLPCYATFNFPAYKFAPTMASHIGVAIIKGNLKNSNGQIQF